MLVDLSLERPKQALTNDAWALAASIELRIRTTGTWKGPHFASVEQSTPYIFLSKPEPGRPERRAYVFFIAGAIGMGFRTRE